MAVKLNSTYSERQFPIHKMVFEASKRKALVPECLPASYSLSFFFFLFFAFKQCTCVLHLSRIMPTSGVPCYRLGRFICLLWLMLRLHVRPQKNSTCGTEWQSFHQEKGGTLPGTSLTAALTCWQQLKCYTSLCNVSPCSRLVEDKRKSEHGYVSTAAFFWPCSWVKTFELPLHLSCKQRPAHSKGAGGTRVSNGFCAHRVQNATPCEVHSYKCSTASILAAYREQKGVSGEFQGSCEWVLATGK